ncbi:MAG: Lrp/AsnC family transcriptional regulator [Azoarcus sp.]|jgi:DNA-binding Lrp family transcriptional regulator|nr:Lrp/AsnC family transcriptional regulator [Azoarcus sp.]
MNAPRESDFLPDELDLALVRATQGGLPLTARPYLALAERLRVSEAKVIARLRALLDAGVVRRIGAVPNHYAIGYAANGMSVWDVDDATVDALGERLATLDFVTHCYRRPRRPPQWTYNLFAMLHGIDREEVLARRDEVRALLGDACRAHDILFSTRLLKKTGVRLPEPQTQD